MAGTFLAFLADFWLVECLGRKGSPNNQQTKNIGCQSLNVYFYRFFPTFLMASTFLAFLADFWRVEHLG